MGDRELLIDKINELAVVHQKVTLSSGREADCYVDMRRVTLDGEAAPLVGRELLRLVADWDFDAVGGLTLGADPVALSMLHAAAARPTAPDRAKLVGFVVPKAVGGAVVRNRVKRRLRHLARAELARTPLGTQLVVRALPPSASSDSLAQDLASAWSRCLAKLADH